MNEKNQPILKKLAEELTRKFKITDDEDLKILADDLRDAAIDALDYCNRDVLVGNMSSAVKDLYVFRRNTEGNEGESSRSEGGVSQTFEIGIPTKIKSKLNRYRVAKVRSFP
ncbi:phage head-tail connector protein [Enterococcus sp. AZ103]|uniref:phage head-tail connector protein n=1 Tax=Enterococcus sp. AZ103 TaxID=2774628 RepID=UPI003F24493A